MCIKEKIGMGSQYSKVLIHGTIVLYVTLIKYKSPLRQTQTHTGSDTFRVCRGGGEKKKRIRASGKLSHSLLKTTERLTAVSVDFGSYPKRQKKKR